MATFQSTQRALGALSPPQLIDQADYGDVLMVSFDYTAPATGMPAAGDNIELCELPKGAKVLMSFLAWDIQASGATLSIGITGTVAKYMAAQTMTAAGVKFGPTLIAEANLVTTAAEVVIGTLATAGFAASGKIKGFLLYAP